MTKRNTKKYEESLLLCRDIINKSENIGIVSDVIKLVNGLISTYPNMPIDRAYELSFKLIEDE